jgi:hypothetical protein
MLHDASLPDHGSNDGKKYKRTTAVDAAGDGTAGTRQQQMALVINFLTHHPASSPASPLVEEMQQDVHLRCS